MNDKLIPEEVRKVMEELTPEQTEALKELKLLVCTVGKSIKKVKSEIEEASDFFDFVGFDEIKETLPEPFKAKAALLLNRLELLEGSIIDICYLARELRK